VLQLLLLLGQYNNNLRLLSLMRSLVTRATLSIKLRQTSRTKQMNYSKIKSMRRVVASTKTLFSLLKWLSRLKKLRSDLTWRCSVVTTWACANSTSNSITIALTSVKRYWKESPATKRLSIAWLRLSSPWVKPTTAYRKCNRQRR